jgi:dihydrofolate reductase
LRKIKLYSAISLNGKIARSDRSVDWLENIPNPENTDYGYAEFYASIDTTIQGFNTYDQILSWGIEFPYGDKINYVLTRKKELENTEFVEFIRENHLEFIRRLKEAPGKDIWLIGGGQINTLLLNANLIDEILIHVMPLVIPDGIELFELIPKETQFKLINHKAYDGGVLELKYSVESNDS